MTPSMSSRLRGPEGSVGEVTDVAGIPFRIELLAA
jgi:hypothetical protein